MITVVGSLNMDLVTRVDRFPKKGETLQGTAFATVFGGKGANQAVAASRLGSQVELVGRIGEDEFGHSYHSYLKKQGVFVSHVKPVTHLSTGTASITVSEDDNSIVIVKGANEEVTPSAVKQATKVIQACNVLMVQLEIPIEAVESAMEIAKKADAIIILNPAPFQPIPSHWWQLVDYVTPNEHEAEELRESPEFKSSYEEKLIVTEGSKGASFMNQGQRQLIPAPFVKVEDTTGAGDTFNGALATGLDRGLDVKEAIQRAVVAASFSVTAFGAQGGMPTESELEVFLEAVQK
ncbi:ribokinase [Jeotgalibacillus marinus]|uniref:Ribokinase n=1 Tax=Jeotgalibacillus marinus TaxID=86667 RepID=A0ABV3Q645_9BACL